MLKPVGPGIAAATNIYYLLHTIRNGLLDQLIVILGPRDKIVVKGIRSQLGKFFSTKPCRAEPRQYRDEMSNQRVWIATLLRFVNGLDIAQAGDVHRLAQIR